MSGGVPVKRSVLVVGTSPDADWVCVELAVLGYRVAWSYEDQADFSPQAPGCAGVTAYPGSRLARLEGHVGTFRAWLEGSDPVNVPVEASAIVVATGNRRVVPWERYGLTATMPNVLTVPQLSAQLRAPRATGPALAHRREGVLVALDLGGETAKETATEALLLAREVNRQWRCEVAVLYQNLKVDTDHLDALTRTMREEGVLFCRYERPDLRVDEEGVAFACVEGTLRGTMLVVPEDVAPAEDTAELSALLNVRLGADGFLQEVNVRHYRPGIAERKGIYYAGRCHMDADPATLRQDATRAAWDVDALLRDGILMPDPIRAHVDEAKCVRCLTCVRTCPHAAVEIAAYEQVTAARVVDLACYGCGACVAHCPVQAIGLWGLSVPAWAQRDGVGVAAS